MPKIDIHGQIKKQLVLPFSGHQQYLQRRPSGHRYLRQLRLRPQLGERLRKVKGVTRVHFNHVFHQAFNHVFHHVFHLEFNHVFHQEFNNMFHEYLNMFIV